MKFILSLLLISAQAFAANQVVFALRADNSAFAARYSCQSTAAQQVGAGVISYDVDVTTINGHNINMDQASNALRVLQYPFRGCLTTKAYSVLLRVKWSVNNTLSGMWHIGQAGSELPNDALMFINSQLYQVAMYNEATTTIKNGSTGLTPATASWEDIVVTTDGTTGANKFKVWVNGSATSFTGGAALQTTTWHDTISVGGVTTGVPLTQMKIEEFVVWNYEIDPTAVTLDSGTGSLSGPTRVSPVTVAAFNGGNYTDPGVANVLSSQGGYVFGGTTNVGTYVDVGAATNVKHGVSYGVGLSGTYSGSDYWTDPGAANVKSGTTYTANNVSTAGLLKAKKIIVRKGK